MNKAMLLKDLDHSLLLATVMSFALVPTLYGKRVVCHQSLGSFSCFFILVLE